VCFFKIEVNKKIIEVSRVIGGFSEHPRYWIVKNNSARKPIREEYWKIYKKPGMELEAPPYYQQKKEFDLEKIKEESK